MDPYVGEIRLFAGPYVPEDWIACNGQLLSINSYQALFALLGTTYGGDGTTNFGAPNLQGALVVGQSPSSPPGMSNAYPLGQAGGAYQVTLTPATLPAHGHAANASTAAATTVTPGPTVTLASVTAGYTAYVTGGTPTTVVLEGSAVSTVGGGQPHDNVMPSLPLTYIMCAIGLYPMPN